MLFMYVVFAPILIALATGAFLFVWSHKNASGLGKFFGGFVIALSVLLLILQALQTSKIWQQNSSVKRDLDKMLHQMPSLAPEKKKT